MFVGIFMLVFVLLCATFGSYFISQINRYKENCSTEEYVSYSSKPGKSKTKNKNPFEV